MKAIHNDTITTQEMTLLFSVCQIYKVWKQFTTQSGSRYIFEELFSVCQIYKVWKQFTTLWSGSTGSPVLFSVCQIYKVWKQFTTRTCLRIWRLSCFQYVKFIKFESNSQPPLEERKILNCCFQYVKFIKFESNSQRARGYKQAGKVVFSMSNL